MLTVFENQECNTSSKVYFLHLHVNYFPENLGTCRDEQEEWFHENLMSMEKCYQGKLYVNIVSQIDVGFSYFIENDRIHNKYLFQLNSI